MIRKLLLAIFATTMLITLGNVSLSSAGQGPPFPSLAGAMNFRVMVSTYSVADILTRSVSGRITVLSEGSIYSQAALEGNGYLEFSVPTASPSTWSLEVGAHATRNFAARLVDGYLQLIDTDTDNQPVWYFENGDGTYGFEYYKDTLYVCNQAEVLAPILGRISSSILNPLAADRWTVTTLDSAGIVGSYNSIALDALDQPHISYFDSTNDDLKYYNGTTRTASALDSAGIVGPYASIALDSLGRPHISYYDLTNRDLKYYNGATATASTLDSAGDVGIHTSIALDSSGKPHISYYDVSNSQLKYYNGATATISTFDSAGVVGTYTSIALDSSGKAHISYYDGTNRDLKYYNGATATVSALDSVGSVGQYTSIDLDSTGKPHISYYDSANKNLKYYNGATATASILDSAGDVGSFTSIALDSSDQTHISYYDGTNFCLKYYSGATATASTADSTRFVGTATSIALDSLGIPHISYYDAINNDLKYAVGPMAGSNRANGGIYDHFGGGNRLILGPSREQTSAGFNTARTSGGSLNFFRGLPFSPGTGVSPALEAGIQPLLSGAPGLTLKWTHPDGGNELWALPCDGSGLISSSGAFTTTTQTNNGVPYIQLSVAFNETFLAGLSSGTHSLTYWLWDQDCNKSNYRSEWIDIE